MNYYDNLRYILFKCDWVDVDTGRGYKIDEFGFPLVNFSHLIHVGKRMTDDPFILASQASQVYYVEDERDKDWLVVVKTKPRDVFDVGNGDLSDNDVDIYCDNEPYDTLIENPPNNVNDDLNWARNDVDGTIVDTPLPHDEESFMDDSEYEEDY